MIPKDGTYYPQYINRITLDSNGEYALCYQARTETLLINDTPDRNEFTGSTAWPPSYTCTVSWTLYFQNLVIL